MWKKQKYCLPDTEADQISSMTSPVGALLSTTLKVLSALQRVRVKLSLKIIS